MSGWDDHSDEQLLHIYVNEGTRTADAAFTELVNRFEHRVYAICYRYFGNRGDAEDATQDTFLALARRGETFAGRSKLSTWLYRVAVNTCNDVARKRSRRPRTPVADVTDVAEAGSPGRAADDMAARETQLEVQRALLELDELSRTLIILVAIEGRPYEQVAATMDMPVGTVKSRVHRARAELTDVLTPVLYGTGEHTGDDRVVHHDGPATDLEAPARPSRNQTGSDDVQRHEVQRPPPPPRPETRDRQ